MTDYLKLTGKFVDESFGKRKPHYERTVFWIKQLDSDVDLALQVAAYGHDVERAFNKNENKKKYLIYDNPRDLTKHQEDSGQVMYEFLIRQGVEKKFAKKVKEAISRHEVGGTEDQNLLKDADSISYLDVNAPKHVEWLGEIPYSEIKEKFDWMFARITSDKAKRIAKPFYEKALKTLEKAKEVSE